MLFAPFFGAFTFCLWTRYVYAIAYFHTFDGSSFVHFLVVMFDVLDLHVTCVSTRILVCLPSSMGTLSLSYF